MEEIVHWEIGNFVLHPFPLDHVVLLLRDEMEVLVQVLVEVLVQELVDL